MNVPPSTVSPGSGIRFVFISRSVFELPITMIFSILKNYKFTC